MQHWTQLRPHKEQSRLYRCTKRFPVVVAGRGSGKTELARRKLVRELSIRIPGNSNPEYFYGLPTFAQAKRVAWKHLKRLIPKEWVAGKPNETDLHITTVFGSELYVLGFDKPQRAEGTQYVGGIIDESSDQPPGLFDLTIRPALTKWDGWCWRIGVPKRFGVGAEDFKKAYDIGVAGTDDNIISFHWDSETVLTHAEIEALKSTMDARDYNEQYKARWESVSGAVFHAFDETHNVTVGAAYRPESPIVVSSDFNVNPMCWTIGHRAHNGVTIFDEIFKRNTNTEETLKELKARYGNHSNGWEFTGDATSAARKTAAATTDYIQIHNFAKTQLKGPVKLLYLSSNPPTANRFASCNALLCAADGSRRAFINPKCKRLIADLKHRSYKKDSRDPDDVGDMGHMSDAFGYMVYRYFPLKILHHTERTVISYA